MVYPRNHRVLCLQQHKANQAEEFDPARTGADHLALKVQSREELDAWAAWFARQDVTHSAVVDERYGSVLCFKDPDPFQLETFYRQGIREQEQIGHCVATRLLCVATARPRPSTW